MLTTQELFKILQEINVLYVEDDLQTQEEITKTFQRFFKNIYFALNGKDALEVYQSQPIQLIITDIQMPVMDGISFVEHIREKDLAIPIVMLTAHNNNDYLMSCANLNIQSYILKPINYEKLKKSLFTVIEYLNLMQNILFKINDTLMYDKINCVLKDNEVEHKLKNKEKALMDLLLENKNRVVPYGQIEQVIWYNNDEVMSSSALRTVVKNLRKKSSTNFIVNVSGIGYKLIAD